MKPKHIKECREKEVRRLHKRRREIWTAMCKLGYTKLEKPIRHGWFKEIVITHKVERYKNEAAILEVYDKIEKVFWGRTKEEAQYKWHHQTAKHLIHKNLPTLSKKQFNKLSPRAQSLCTPFQYRTECKKLKIRFYIRIPKGVYRIKYSRAYITHSKRIDPVLESESALLDQKLLKQGFYETDQRLARWKNHWNTPAHRIEKLKVTRALNGLKKHPIEDIIKENLSWEIN